MEHIAHYISILGMGVSDLTLIRRYLKDTLPPEVELHWVNINDPQLSCLIINSNFINSSSVQSILHRKPVPTLLVEHVPGRSGLSNGHLFMPLQDLTEFRHWAHDQLLHNFGTGSLSSAHSAMTSQAVGSPSVEDPVSLALDSILCKAFFSQLKARDASLLQVNDEAGAIGIVDRARQLVWLSNDYRNRAFKWHRNASYEIVDHVPAAFRPRDLKQWLWESASVMMSATTVRITGPEESIALDHWPQPSRHGERNTLLKVCAALQQGPASARTLSTKLSVPLGEVLQIMDAAILSGFAHKPSQEALARIKHDSATVSVAPSATAGRQEAMQQPGLKGMLSRLRSKLGI